MNTHAFSLTLGIVSLAALMSGCGGGGSAVSSPVVSPIQPTVPACIPLSPVKIQLFGDSTMWGYLASGGGVRAAIYPEVALQRLMDAEFGQGAVKVTTRAVSGTMASQLVAGTDGHNAAWPKPVDANIVVINYGINELRHGVPVATYRASLESLSVVPASVQVVFQTPFPMFDSAAPNQSYADAMRDVATARSLPLIDAMPYLLALPSWRTQYATDGFHATAAGYELVATNLQYPLLSRLVKPLLCK